MNRWIAQPGKSSLPLIAALLIAVWSLTSLAAAAGASPALNRIIEDARKECRTFDNGMLTVEEGAITEMDITGDGKPDALVDAGKLTCSTALSLYCGTGGCSLWLVVEDKVTSLLSKGWKKVDWEDQTILLVQVHGSECGGTNLRQCFRALVWSEGDWRSFGGT